MKGVRSILLALLGLRSNSLFFLFFHDDSILLLSSSFPVWISDSLRCDLRFSIVFRRRQASSIFHPYRIKSKD